MSEKDLNTKLIETAEEKVGKKAVTSKFGTDCFALVDKLLRSLGADTAKDGNVEVTADADYDWGETMFDLDTVQPGDILQFSNHVVEVKVFQGVNDDWFETSVESFTRPYHTSIVTEVRKDGSVVVVEQNVRPNPKKVTRNVIMKLQSCTETRFVNKEKIVLKVKGDIFAYRPDLKEKEELAKGASLHQLPMSLMPTGRRRELASYIPSLGGVKRKAGTIGMVRRRRWPGKGKCIDVIV